MTHGYPRRKNAVKTVLPDGRFFETLPFINIIHIPDEPVYKFKFDTADRSVKSSSRHQWAVWNKQTKRIEMLRMDMISVDNHELLVQGWEKHDV